jgi:hypothetical protein
MVRRPSVDYSSVHERFNMNTELSIEYLWIPQELGWHRSHPYRGMRPKIRWQRYLREHLERSRDVECTSMAFDPVTMRGVATLRLTSDDSVPTSWLHEGGLIDLLDGYRVIAVGRIAIARPPATDVTR